MQIDAANGQQMGECLASLLTSIPRIPDEVFAYAVCSSAGYANQQQVNDCTVVVMDAIRRKKGLLLAESCVVLFARLLLRAGGQQRCVRGGDRRGGGE